MANSVRDAQDRHHLRRRLLVLVAVLLSLLVIDAAAAAGLADRRRHEQSQIRERLVPAVVAADRLLTAYIDQETGLRGFVLTGEPQFLDPYRTGLRTAQATNDELRRLLAEHPGALERLDEVGRRATQWRDGAASPEIAARSAGDFAGAVAIVESGIGKRRFDALRDAHAGFRNEVRNEMSEATSRQGRGADIANWITMLSALMALLATAVLLGQLQQRVLRPVLALARAVRRAAVDPGAGPVLVPGATGELQDVAENAEALRQVAVSETHVARRAEAALAQEAPTVQAVLDELASNEERLPDGYACASRTQAHEGLVTGDLHDRLIMPDGRLAVLVADASGHGPEAALVAVRLKAALLGSLRLGHSPAAALDRAAVELGDTGERFVTAFVGLVEPATGQLVYANAGHPAALLLPASADTHRELGPTGPLLGPLPGHWSDRGTQLPPGHTLLVITDGVMDAANREGVRYGRRRLLDLLAGFGRNVQADPDTLVRQVLDDVASFSAGRLGDDRTALALCRSTAGSDPLSETPGRSSQLIATSPAG